ncbi:MAG: hypothetical protein P4M08_15735 [Oligoflexia bacterium]|nr:hypothetical protein [Oligoflexia bacterium]
MKSTFTATVTENGGEVVDSFPDGSPISFTLQCDGIPLYSLTGTRFTNLLGTRIVSLTPTTTYPQFTLPRGSLSTGTHDAFSTLEILNGLTPVRLRGSCTITST